MHCNIFVQTAGVLVPAISSTGFSQGATPQAVRQGMSNTGMWFNCTWVPVLDKQGADTLLRPTGRNKPSVGQTVWAPVFFHLLLLFPLTKVSESLVP